jgi:hypothetical protein
MSDGVAVAGRSGFRMHAGASYISLIKIVQTGSGAHQRRIQRVTGLFPGRGGEGLNVTTHHLHLVPSISMCKALILLPVFDFTA